MNQTLLLQMRTLRPKRLMLFSEPHILQQSQDLITDLQFPTIGNCANFNMRLSKPKANQLRMDEGLPYGRHAMVHALYTFPRNGRFKNKSRISNPVLFSHAFTMAVVGKDSTGKDPRCL